MLIDLDLAVSVDKHGRSEQTEARTMTGTLEYMTIEILKGGLNPETACIEHTYRHDLESFFYVLCQCVCVTAERMEIRQRTIHYVHDTLAASSISLRRNVDTSSLVVSKFTF